MPAMSYDAAQQRIDDARETLIRPDVRAGSASVFQWDEETHGRFRFSRTALVSDDDKSPKIANAAATTSRTPDTEKTEPTGTTIQGVKRPTSPIVGLRRLASPAKHFAVLQRWEGTVTTVSNLEFSGTLRDLTSRAIPEEQATFDLNEVSEEDRALLVPGAVFYWAIGYETNEVGQVSRVSRIRLRRLPRWTKNDLRRVDERARRLEALFGITRQ